MVKAKLTREERVRRDGMVWLLYTTDGTTLGQLSALFEVSTTSIKAIVARVSTRMQRATIRPCVCPAYWRRLSAAGALVGTTGHRGRDLANTRRWAARE